MTDVVIHADATNIIDYEAIAKTVQHNGLAGVLLHPISATHPQATFIKRLPFQWIGERLAEKPSQP